jgi:hypothetical protein
MKELLDLAQGFGSIQLISLDSSLACEIGVIQSPSATKRDLWYSRQGGRPECTFVVM